MGEADDYLTHAETALRGEHSYAFINADEFVAEAFSNPKFQETLSLIPLSNELAGKLGLHAKTGSVWDAVKQIISGIIEAADWSGAPTYGYGWDDAGWRGD